VIRGFIGGLLACLLVSPVAADLRQIPPQNARFIGAVGCKSSSCHGGAGEKRSQFITWSRQDFHTRGYAILTNARSARMAESLGLADAPTSARCTICHSPFQAVPPARLTATADPRESVSCENCHGAAEPWLRGHTRRDWTYATRIGAGMRDLKSFYVRANTCVACHQNLDTDIAAAGHPDLLFEMDGQSIAEPKHWRDPDGSGTRAWLVGQAVALRETSWQLAANPTRSSQTLGQWQGLHWLLARVTAADRTSLPIDPNATRDPSGFARIQEQADALARRAAQENFSSDFTRRLLRDLVGADADFAETFDQPRELLFRRGQRLVLALERLTSTENNVTEELRVLRADLRTPAEFQPTDFVAHLSKLRLKLAL